MHLKLKSREISFPKHMRFVEKFWKFAKSTTDTAVPWAKFQNDLTIDLKLHFFFKF